MGRSRVGLGHRKKAVITQRADRGGFSQLLLDLGENTDSCLLCSWHYLYLSSQPDNSSRPHPPSFFCCSFSIVVGFLPFHLDRILLFQGRLLWLWTFRRLRRGSRPRFPPFNPSPKHLREEARENGLQRGTNLRSRLLCLLLLWGLSRLGLAWGSVRKAEPKAASRELSQRTGRSLPADAPRRRKRPPLEVGDRVPDETQRPAICDFQIMSNFLYTSVENLDSGCTSVSSLQGTAGGEEGSWRFWGQRASSSQEISLSLPFHRFPRNL